MVAAKNVDVRRAICWACQVLVWGFLPVFVAYGQETSNQTDEYLKAKALQVIGYLKEGVYGPATQEEIDQAQAGYLVSLLEERFVRSQDVDIKARVAKSLLDLGDKGQAYWDFLVQQAKLAIESDAPSPRCFSSANCVGGHPAEYVAWARVHNIAEGSQAEKALEWLEGKVSLIEGDPRAIPLFREALKSPYREIVYTGAKGLARAHDKDSIPLIVEACKRFHDAGEVRLIAQWLGDFKEDPETLAAAQAGEEQCLPSPDPIEALRRNDGNSLVYVQKAVATRPAETIAILKENFANTQDERQKADIASTLIGFGNKEDFYWDFLLRQATLVLERKPIEGPVPYEVSAKQDEDFMILLTFIETVAETRDPRGIEILRGGLSSPRYQDIAAAGLVRARDNDSIPLIIDLCKNASPEMMRSIAMQVLVYFDDPRAQSAVDQYLSKEDAKFAREEKAGGIGPLGPWPPEAKN